MNAKRGSIKVWGVVWVMLLCALLPLAAFARAAYVPTLGLSVSLPQTLDAFTRDMAADDPLLALYGTTAQDVASVLSARGLWMEARDIAGKFVITLETRSDSGPDYASIGDADLLAAAPSNAEILRTRQAAFILHEQGGGMVCVTRVGGTLFTLRLTPSGTLRNNMTNTLRSVAQGMDFFVGQ